MHTPNGRRLCSGGIVTWLLLWLPLILLAVYPVAIQYERGGWWRCLFWVYFPAVVLNVFLNHTTLALYLWDFPARGEWTFSTRVRRLQYYPGWRGAIARLLKTYLNFWQKGHV